MKKKICVVGGGRWVENHIRTLHELGHLVAIVESDQKRLTELKERYPGFCRCGQRYFQLRC